MPTIDIWFWRYKSESIPFPDPCRPFRETHKQTDPWDRCEPAGLSRELWWHLEGAQDPLLGQLASFPGVLSTCRSAWRQVDPAPRLGLAPAGQTCPCKRAACTCIFPPAWRPERVSPVQEESVQIGACSGVVHGQVPLRAAESQARRGARFCS